jgi:hypothetical protein
MTSQLIDQRVRNRIIEMLEWLIECESTPPQLGMDELINSWEDWVPIPVEQGYFPCPVFTSEEADLLCKVSSVIRTFCEITPKSIQDGAAAVALPQWVSVISAAKSALSVMCKRGRMSEDEEQYL